MWRILKRLELNRLPASQRYKRHDQRWKRYEKQLPGHRSRSTSSSSSRSPALDRRKHYQFTAIDDCTRLRVLRIYPKNNQKTAIQFVDYVLEQAAVPRRGDPDRQRRRVPVAFHWHLLDRGIGHVYIKPSTPRLNGKVERSHRIDAEEFYRLLDGVVIDDADALQRQAPRVGGLLQLPPTPRRPRRPDPLRTTTPEDHRDLSVTGLRQSHINTRQHSSTLVPTSTAAQILCQHPSPRTLLVPHRPRSIRRLQDPTVARRS